MEPLGQAHPPVGSTESTIRLGVRAVRAQDHAHKHPEVSLVDQLFEPHQQVYPPFPISLVVKFSDDGRRDGDSRKEGSLTN